jgi:hypothetical protein
MLRHYIVTPGLAFTFLACSDPDFWSPVFAYADLARIRELDFEVEGRRCGIYGHDWRTVPVAAWFELLSRREVDASASPPGPREMAEFAVLSQPDFRVAVRRALRDYAQPSALRENPLLRSRLVASRVAATADPGQRIAAFQALLREATESLKASPRTSKGFEALYHTYFQPAPSQERAAELLDIPFSTFRRHLKAGIERVIDLLWLWEVGGTGGLPGDDRATHNHEAS